MIVAIENSLVRLDIQDTLESLGIGHIRCVSTPAQALVAVNKERCTAFILGLEGANPESQQLVDALEQLRIPVVIVASGVNLVETLPRLSRVENLRVPFDSTSLAAALHRALQSWLTPPDAS